MLNVANMQHVSNQKAKKYKCVGGFISICNFIYQCIIMTCYTYVFLSFQDGTY